MTRKEIILDAAGGARLTEVRHGMERGLSVSRYRLSMAGTATTCEFRTLRKARAAFLAQIAEARLPGRKEGA